MNDETEYLYRFEDKRYSVGIDEFENDLGCYTQVNLYRFKILKRTPKGAWIDLYGDKRFVNLERKKKYACSTVEDAKISFKARKIRQISIYRGKLEIAQKALSLIDFHNGKAW